MARHGVRAQRDLFALARATSSLPAAVRQDLLGLLEALLLEVTTSEAAAQEAGDEQDHG